MIKAVKGTRDILPPSSAAWNQVEAVAREVFRTYNYQEIRTPILEETALFARGVGEDTDIVSKEMYTFEDRDGSSLTLRPEATASVIRAYIEHRLDQQPGLQKLYYIGPMFRRERPQKGRYRQFFQIGAEAIGSESPAVDAEVIEMVVEMLRRAGLEGFQLLLNSVGDQNCRPQYVALLKEKLDATSPAKLCEDCQRRSETNPLRVLDCKVPEDQPIIDALPSILDHLCEACQAHFKAVRAHLDDRGIPYEVRPRMVRGLDYYMRTTFEIVHGALGAQNSVLGGGRYDGLAESLGSHVHSPGHRLLHRRGPPGDERRAGTSRCLQTFARPLYRAHRRRGRAPRRASGQPSRDLPADPWNWASTASSSGRSNWPTKWARTSR